MLLSVVRNFIGPDMDIEVLLSGSVEGSGTLGSECVFVSRVRFVSLELPRRQLGSESIPRLDISLIKLLLLAVDMLLVVTLLLVAAAACDCCFS